MPKPGCSNQIFTSVNSSEEIQTVSRQTLSMQVDCVGWNQDHNLLAVGGYELMKSDTSIRTGILYLIAFDPNLPNGSTIIQEEPSSGILDLKWEANNQIRLALATSNSVTVYELNVNDVGLFTLDKKYLYLLEAKSTVMALYLEWMNEDKLIYSDSTGHINMLQILDKQYQQDQEFVEDAEICTEELKYLKELKEQRGTPIVNEYKELALVERVNLHDYTIWVVHFDSKSKIIYTGADDGTFTAFTEDNFLNRSKYFVKRFPVGVTSINTKDDIVAIGCYDDMLRIYTFSLENESSRILLTHHAEINLGGSVWRTIFVSPIVEIKTELDTDTVGIGQDEDEVKEYKIGVAAARNGVHFLTLKRSAISWSWERNLSCVDYKGFLAYGIDIKVNAEENVYTVANCYFDNHVLHVWKANIF